jgi:hypothetical protein
MAVIAMEEDEIRKKHSDTLVRTLREITSGALTTVLKGDALRGSQAKAP